jgi:hypothetical protein
MLSFAGARKENPLDPFTRCPYQTMFLKRLQILSPFVKQAGGTVDIDGIYPKNLLKTTKSGSGAIP